MATFEFILFGGGVGECILLKNAKDEWYIIDSCLEPSTRKPIASVYLNDCGIPNENVKLIIATHWHDDHVKGLSSLVVEYEKAKVLLSTALNQEEFFAMIATEEKHARVLKELSSGVQEFYKVFNFIRDKNAKHRISWAGSNKTIINCHGFKLFSLSPSDLEITLSKTDFASMLPIELDSLLSITKKNPNHSSVVVWGEDNDFKFLCGADLEVTNNPNTGWESIFKNSTVINLASPLPLNIMKAAHHGSENGYYKELWDIIVDNNSFCLITPFSRCHLPKKNDLLRISCHTEKVFCTANPRGKKYKSKNATIDKVIKEATLSHKIISQELGMLKITHDFSTDKIDIQKSGPAMHFTDLIKAIE